MSLSEEPIQTMQGKRHHKLRVFRRLRLRDVQEIVEVHRPDLLSVDLWPLGLGVADDEICVQFKGRVVEMKLVVRVLCDQCSESPFKARLLHQKARMPAITSTVSKVISSVWVTAEFPCDSL